MTDIARARTLIATTALPALAGFAADAPDGGGMPTFDAAKKQALVIGSDVLSFGTGVDADFRQAISDSALFAQLAALNRTGNDPDPMKFFDAYFQIMMGLGWLEQERDTSELEVHGAALDVHQAVTGVITAFLAPIAGAAAAVLAVLNGLHQMNAQAPFITLFNKRSVREKTGKFQFTYVHKDPTSGGLLAEMAAFGLVARDNVTQILFFRLQANHAALQRSLGKLSIDPTVLTDLRPNLAGKVKDYRTAMIAEAKLGPIPD